MAKENEKELNTELDKPNPEEMPLLENTPINDLVKKVDRSVGHTSKSDFSKQFSWLMKCALCILLPPIGVVFHGFEFDRIKRSADFKYQLLLNVLLTFCGILPGQLHAAWYCFYKKIE
ncbi:hypothetical protein niasHS_017336 [Heterodera schachtii]